MKCSNCGAPIGEGMRFCMNCGTPVSEKPVESQTAEQPEADEAQVAQEATATPVSEQPQQAEPQQAEPQPQPVETNDVAQPAPMYNQPVQSAPPVNQPPVVPQQPFAVQGPAVQGFAPGQPYVPPVAPKKNGKKIGIIIAVVCVAVAAVIAVILSVIISASRVNMKNYINDDIDAVGYNGYATVYDFDAIDYYDLIEDLGGVDIVDFEEEVDDIEDFEDLEDFLDGIYDYYDYEDLYDSRYEIYDYITVAFDKSEYLSNGDVVTATITVNYDAINTLGFDKKLHGKESYTVNYKISGLEEIDVFDPYEAVKEVAYFESSDWAEVTLDTEFTGELGECTFSVSDNEIDIYNAGDYVDSFYIYASADNYSKSGTVELAISCDTEQYSESYGFVIGPASKKVEPVVYSYLMENLVNEADYKLIKAASDKAISDDSYYENAKFYNAYFACNDSDAYDKNAIVLVYSYDSWWEEGHSQYMAYKFEDFTVNSETNSIYFMYDSTPYVFEYLYGYDSASDLFQDITLSYETVEELTVK